MANLPNGQQDIELLDVLVRMLSQIRDAIKDVDFTSSVSLTEHSLLSTTHSDTVGAVPVRGDLLRGNSTPEWARLAIGAANAILGTDGSDPAWEASTGTGSPVRASSPTLTTPTIGSFANSTHTHQNAAGGGTLDHGLALTGLTDDDHTQYALLAGRSGGQVLIGGTAATNSLDLQSTSGVGTTDHIKFLVGNNGATEAGRFTNAGRLQRGVPNLSVNAPYQSRTSDISFGYYETDNTGSLIAFFINRDHASSPGQGANVVRIDEQDSGGTRRITNTIANRFVDNTSTTMDSELQFQTMNAVNAGDANTTATLSSAGVWTDAPCDLEHKEYEGTPDALWGDPLSLIKQLSVSRFHAKGLAIEKQRFERHCGPTMDQLHELFGVGTLNRKTNKLIGIAALDVAGIALVGVQALIGRIEQLEARR